MTVRLETGKAASSLVSSLVLVSGLGAPETEATSSSPSSPTSSSAEEDAGSQSSSRLKVTSRGTPYNALAGEGSFPIQASEPMWAPAARILRRVKPHCS